MLKSFEHRNYTDVREDKDSPKIGRHEDLIKHRKQDKNFEVEILRYNNGLVDMIFDILCIEEKWMKNENAVSCSKCQQKFGLLLRKHHCRACGRVFCSTCSNYTLHLKCSKWFEHPDIIKVFTKQLKCIFDTKGSQFEMKICVSCFQNDLDNQIAEFSDIEGIKKFLKQSFSLAPPRVRKTSLSNVSFPLKEKIQLEFMEFILKELRAELKEETPSVEFLKEFLSNAFIEFENLSKYKLDFNHINICDLIPVIRLPDDDLSIEFFPGLVLQLDSNTHYDQAHNISLPNILLLRKNFCPSKSKGPQHEQFKYFAVEDLDRINKSNIDFIESIISQKNINIVISEHSLPAKIYFLLKSKKIDIIFPLKHSKINLIEKITKSSQLRTHFEKNYRHGHSNGEVEELWLPGELEIKEVKILDRNFSYYAYIKKNNPRKSFNTFSIIIKGPMNKQTKIIKEKFQELIPMLFYKFFEHNIINSEMMLFNKFAKYDFSKSFLKSKISTMGHTHQLGNFLETDFFFKSIMADEYKLDYFQTFCMLQTEENTFNEFQPQYRILIDNKPMLQKQLESFDYSSNEFLSLFPLFNSDHFTYLANLNLSKSTCMLKLCNLPEQMFVRLFGQNDVNIVKVVLDILNNNEILCPNCFYKFKFHRRFIYLNMHSIKVQSYTIDYYNGDLILPKIEQEPDILFEKNAQVIMRSNQPNNIKQLEDGKLRFGLFCETCCKIIGNLVVLPEAYRNMSYALFLYFYTLDIDMETEDVEGVVRDRQDSNKNTLFETLFKTHNELSEICVHKKLTRAFFMNNNFVTYFKMPLICFQLITNHQLKSKSVDVTDKFNKATLWQRNFKFLVNYYISILRILEEMILEKPGEPNSKLNLLTIERAIQFYNMLLPIDPLAISDKSQFAANRNFLKFYQEMVNKYTTFRSFSCELIIRFEIELKFDNISKVVDYISAKNEGKSESMGIESWQNQNNLKIPEIHSNIESSSNNNKSSFNSNFHHSFTLLSRKSHNNNKNEIENFTMPYQAIDPDNRNKANSEYIVGDYEFIYFDNPVNKYANFLYHNYTNRKDTIPSQVEKQIRKELVLHLDEELELARLGFVLDSDDESIFHMLMRENRLLLAHYFRQLMAYKFSIPMSKSVKYKLKEYYPVAFENLRIHLKIETEYFMHSLSQIENFSPSGGQTNASFFITKDNKYVIKEISKREFNYFMDFCVDYIKYMLDNSSSRSPSFLCRIFGVFKSERRIFVVMENLTYFVSDVNTSIKNYDLKGSELNRFKLKVKPNSTLTDTNFLIERNGDPLYLDTSYINNFWQILSRDSLFLEQKNIIDYSLFVSLDINRKVCFMKIIDFFRSYDLIKNVETKWKTIRNKDLPTIINPQEYRARFLHNSRKYFLIPE